jgi:3-hydroxyisobutyrate dehydrogenase-like beta-hydroxyacid dehydrogenase
MGHHRDISERCHPILRRWRRTISKWDRVEAVRCLVPKNLKTKAKNALIAEILAIAEIVGAPMKPLFEVFGVSSANSFSLQMKTLKIATPDYEPGFMLRFANKALNLGIILV